MSTATTAPPTRREPELFGQTVVVIDGSIGMRLGTARRARAEGARLILTGIPSASSTLAPRRSKRGVPRRRRQLSLWYPAQR
jgi:hypothetical protein